MKFYKEFNGVVSINGKQFLKEIAFPTARKLWELVSRISSGNEPVVIDGVQFKHLTIFTYSADEMGVMRKIFPNDPAFWPENECRGVHFDVSIDVDGNKSVRFHNGGDGYRGYLTDTVYSDGESGTWWNQFVWVPNSVSEEELIERIENAY